MTMDPYNNPPNCVDCGEPDPGCPDGRCRECDIEHGLAIGSCRECLTFIMREDFAGPKAKQHDAGCSLASTDDYAPRTDAEVADVRKRRYGWAPEAKP